MTETTLEERREEVTGSPATVAVPFVQKMHILICHHQCDDGTTLPLERHLQLMYRRLGNKNRHYFRYEDLTEPKPYTGDSQYCKDEYQKAKTQYEESLKAYNTRRTALLHYLQQEELLLILYVSNSFVERLWKDMGEDSQLKDLLSNPNHRIVPVLVRPTAGMAAENSQPLCAYEGVALESACQRITANIESIARDYFGEDVEFSAVTPFTLLTSPNTVHAMPLSETDRTQMLLTGLLGPLQTIVEQSNARVVEAQQQALSERVIREGSEADLRRQVKEMKEQLTKLQDATVGAGLLRRLFGSSK